MKVNLTKLLDSSIRVTFNNKHTTDASYLPIKDATVKIEDSPYAFFIDKEIEPWTTIS